jgi:hypothetical protein
VTALDTRLAADLSDRDLARLMRLITVFRDDPQFDLNPMHVRERWAELAAEDHGEGVVHFESREAEIKARRKRGVSP